MRTFVYGNRDKRTAQRDQRVPPLAAHAPGGRRFAKDAVDKMAEANVVDRDFDRFKIDPAEFRASLDIGRNRAPSAE